MKRILLCYLFLFISVFCFAQVSIELKGGANISTTKNRIAVAGERAGYYFGGLLKKEMSNRFFLQPEILYSSKGDSFKPPYASHEGGGRFNYLNIPVLLGFQVDCKLALLLGPEVGYLIRSRIRYEKSVFEATKNYPRWDAAMYMGVKYRINKSLGAELRYSYGFNTIYYTDPVGQRSEVNGGHRVFQVGMNYIL